MRQSILLLLLSVNAATCVCLSLFAQESTPGIPGVAQRNAAVNFADLAQQRPLAPATAGARPGILPRPQRRPDKLVPATTVTLRPTPEVAAISIPTPSPTLTTNFLAVTDDNTAIPPDTMGAVGPHHIMTTLNSQVRIQGKTGTTISTVDLNAFWASVGSPNAYDPHVVYDAAAGHWIFSAAADSPSAALLLGVSATSDPTGLWYLHSTDVDASNQLWADYDNLGFNTNWVVVSANLFTNNSASGFDSVAIFVYDKSDLLQTNHPAAFTRLTMPSTSQAFALVPAQTFDNTLSPLYLVEDWDGTAGELRVSTITGPVGGEVLTIGTAFPATSSTWEDYNIPKNFAPQLGSTTGIDAGDARVLTCLSRNGSLWVTQNAPIPVSSPTRCAAQWWQFRPGGLLQQFSRVDDPTGKTFYCYPSLAVNASNDVLVGYSRFSKTQYVSGNYSFRFATDPPNTLRADTVLKAGEGPYSGLDTSGVNRWGDYSATVVDPANDMTFWTIQEYAAAGNLWSTWWGRLDPTPPATTWEINLSGAGTGTGILTFNSDFTVSGYGLLRRTFGLLTVSGTWAYNTKRQITGTYTESLSGTNFFTGNLLGTISRANRFAATVRPATRGPARHLSGMLAAPAPNISGTYTGLTKAARLKLSETFTLTPSASFSNLWDLAGQGPTYTFNGAVLATSRNALSAVTTNGPLRSLTGTFKLPGKITLTGTDDQKHAVTLKATRIAGP